MTEICLATRDDAGAILDVLERAMAEDPFVSWLARPGPRHARARRAYLSLMLERIALPKGEVTIAKEGSEVIGAALWAPPHTFELGATETLRLLPLMLDVVGFGRMSDVSDVLDRIEAARPPEPRWLLTVLGVDPAARGQGTGAALLAPVVARCAASGVPAVAETANAKALPFYERLGFERVSERRLAPGVTSWTVVR